MSSAIFPCLFLLVGVALARTEDAVEITSEPHHHFVLQNEYVRVFKVEVAPHDATLLHRHRHDYIFVNLGKTEISNEAEGKAPVKATLQDGEVKFSSANLVHLVRALGNSPFRNVSVEFMKNGSAPANSEQETGSEFLPGKAQKILFVKDGIRVSEAELQPGGAMPDHHGPRLIIAVSQCELRNGEGNHSENLAPGDVKWSAAENRESLSNGGQRPAKFVVLEF